MIYRTTGRTRARDLAMASSKVGGRLRQLARLSLPASVATIFAVAGLTLPVSKLKGQERPMPRPATQPDQNESVNRLTASAVGASGVLRMDVGVTRRGTRIPCLLTAEDFDLATAKTRVSIVAGLDGSRETAATVVSFIRWFQGSLEAAPLRRRFALSAVPLVVPDRQPTGQSSGAARPSFPPTGTAYSDQRNPESIYLWRWIGMHGPDLVIVLDHGDRPRLEVPLAAAADLQKIREKLGGQQLPDANAGDLASQLVSGRPAGVGAVPAIRWMGGRLNDLKQTLEALDNVRFRGPSAARRELQKRVARSPLDTAKQLARHYGHDLKSVVYIPALALVGRLRLGQLTDDPSHLRDVERIVEPYRSGDRPTFGNRVSGSHLSGHLVFCELARRTGNRRYIQLAQRAADLGFGDDGKPLPAMPHHNEMSDAVFMGTPILMEVGRLTGDAKYTDMARRHLRFMLQLNLRDDGLHRHSPLDRAAWGRGNGFPALGLAWSLSVSPDDHPSRLEMLAVFRRHLTALLKHQDAGGMWHQVVDHPESYRELSCTSMITFAMIRGLRRGWLDPKTFEQPVERAFRAIQTRIAADGTLVDVCTGTGKQRNLRAYLDRKAILGRDPRGGAMALLVTTEMAFLRREHREN